MQKYTFHREQTGLFNQQSNWLAYDQEQLSDFISKPFNRNNLYEQARKKGGAFLPENREVLVTSLQDQYSTLPPNQFVNKQIQRLKDKNTLTIVTGHQPVVFGGPAYTMYKILHVIRLCEELNAEQQEIHFVPVFWLAGEDHDFEEMRSMKLFQSEIGLDEKLGGAFGRYPFAPVEELKERVASFFRNSDSNEIDDLLNNYKGETIVEATQSLFHYLFGDNGLIVLNPDRKELKHLFSPIMAEEVRNQRAFKAMNADKDRFLASGLKAQAHPRAINLFYLAGYSRQRIEPVEDHFFIEGRGTIQQLDLLEELKTNPERFSPNVILRPLYQEMLLPNVCYVGGVGELAYWLQLSPVFKAFDIVFPLIQPRCSLAIIEKRWEKKLSRSGLAMEDFFRPLERIKSERTEKAAAENFDFNALNSANTQLKVAAESLFNQLDQNAIRSISKEIHQCEEAIQRMMQTVLRSVKGKQEQELKDLNQLFQGVFPNGNMQERAVSFFQFCPDGKMKQRLNQLRDLIDPFDPDFIFIKE